MHLRDGEDEAQGHPADGEDEFEPCHSNRRTHCCIGIYGTQRTSPRASSHGWCSRGSLFDDALAYEPHIRD